VCVSRQLALGCGALLVMLLVLVRGALSSSLTFAVLRVFLCPTSVRAWEVTCIEVIAIVKNGLIGSNVMRAVLHPFDVQETRLPAAPVEDLGCHL
jgi:hypothetical protein